MAPNHPIFQRFGVSSSASPEQTDKVENDGATRNAEPTNTSGDSKLSDQAEDSGPQQSKAADQAEESGPISESKSTMCESVKRRRKGTKRTAFSDSDTEKFDELTMEDLIKLVSEKEELLKVKHIEIEKMQDKVLRSYAEMENVMDRTRREAENSKKFAVQVSSF